MAISKLRRLLRRCAPRNDRCYRRPDRSHLRMAPESCIPSFAGMQKETTASRPYRKRRSLPPAIQEFLPEGVRGNPAFCKKRVPPQSYLFRPLLSPPPLRTLRRFSRWSLPIRPNSTVPFPGTSQTIDAISPGRTNEFQDRQCGPTRVQDDNNCLQTLCTCRKSSQIAS